MDQTMLYIPAVIAGVTVAGLLIWKLGKKNCAP